MIEFGKTLRTAREARGLTTAQVAEMTRMPPSRVQELENEDFSRISAPIYGRGFVKLYCEAVGLVPKPMVDEFMAIFNGEHDVGIKERSVPKPQEQVREVPADEPRQEPPSVREPPSAKQHPDPIEISANQPPMPEYDLFSTATETISAKAKSPLARRPISVGAGFSRYTKSIAQMKMPKIPHWRFGVLLAGAACIVIVVSFGFRALYRATSGDRASAAVADVRTNQATVRNDGANAIKRTPQKIPSLYID